MVGLKLLKTLLTHLAIAGLFLRTQALCVRILSHDGHLARA